MDELQPWLYLQAGMLSLFLLLHQIKNKIRIEKNSNIHLSSLSLSLGHSLSLYLSKELMLWLITASG